MTLPPEIGQCRSLEQLQTYTSRAHFWPYEMRRCKKLNHVHGNCIYIDMSSLFGRLRFPDLPARPSLPGERHSRRGKVLSAALQAHLPLDLCGVVLELALSGMGGRDCSMCGKKRCSVGAAWTQRAFRESGKDVLPYLANLCESATCRAALDTDSGGAPTRERLIRSDCTMCDVHNVVCCGGRLGLEDSSKPHVHTTLEALTGMFFVCEPSAL